VKVEVELFSTFQRGRFKKSTFSLEDNSNVQDLLAKLEISPDEVGIIIVNRKDAKFNQPLNDKDIVTFIPLIGGG